MCFGKSSKSLYYKDFWGYRVNRIAWGFKTASFSFLLFFQITADIIPRFVLFVKRFIKKIRFFLRECAEWRDILAGKIFKNVKILSFYLLFVHSVICYKNAFKNKSFFDLLFYSTNDFKYGRRFAVFVKSLLYKKSGVDFKWV